MTETLNTREQGQSALFGENPNRREQRTFIARVSAQLEQLIDQDADDEEIGKFLTSQGVSVDDIRAFNQEQSPPPQRAPVEAGPGGEEEIKALPIAARIAGGLAGATVGFASPLPGGALIGGALGAEGFGQAADIWQRFLDEEQPPPLEKQFREASTNILVDLTLTGAGGLIAKGGKAVAQLPFKLLAAEKQKSIQALANWQKLNVSLRGGIGGLTSNKNVMGAQELLAKIPGGANVIQDAILATRLSLGEAFEEILGRVGVSRTAQQAGEVLIEGIGRGGGKPSGFIGRAQAKSADLYNKVFSHFNPSDKIIMPETAAFFRKNYSELAGLDNTQKSVVPAMFLGYAEDLNKNLGHYTFRQLKTFRTYVGEQMNSTSLVSDIPKAQWKRLYGALSQDLRAGVQTKGLPAMRDFQAATAHHAETATRIEAVLDDVVRDPAVERAFQKAFLGDKLGSSKLEVIKKSLTPGEWHDVVAAKLHLMGVENPGAAIDVQQHFSPRVFLTSYNRLANESKDILFGSSQSGLRKELDTLLDVIGDISSSKLMSNPSGTAGGLGFFFTLRNMGFGAAIGSVVTGDIEGGIRGAAFGAASTAGGLAAINAGAKLMTNPVFVKWVAQGARISPANFAGITAHLGRLVAIAKGQPEIREEIALYLDTIQADEDDVTNAAIDKELSNYYKRRLRMKQELSRRELLEENRFSDTTRRTGLQPSLP